MKKDKRIFIIEKERLIGLDLQLELENKGYKVYRPLSLEEIEAFIGSNRPDLIIADCDIQQQEGFERMKKYFHRQQLSIICIGTKINEILKENEGINIIGSFTKPFESKTIVALVNKYFQD